MTDELENQDLSGGSKFASTLAMGHVADINGRIMDLIARGDENLKEDIIAVRKAAMELVEALDGCIETFDS